MEAMWLPYFQWKYLKGTLYLGIIQDAVLLPAALAIGKILGYSELDPLEVKGNHLADISARNAALNVTNNSQISVMVQRDIFPNYNLEELATEAQ